MSKESKPSRMKVTPYQLLGWTPLLLVAVGSSIVVALSIMSKR
ncbi:hypothetical protein MCEGKSH29_00483 [Candidatus Nanopelagicaceae bacterium]